MRGNSSSLGSIKSQIDQIWNAFWSGGISNPLEVVEQITASAARRAASIGSLTRPERGRSDELLAAEWELHVGCNHALPPPCSDRRDRCFASR
jgi:hypothetical protein